ncbi:MAG: LysE family translocator [Vulcanimicrobiaceae bacterium]
MDQGTWLAFVVLEAFLCLTPGPAVMFVVGTALGRGRAGGFAATAGIVAGNTVYFILSATSLGAILMTSYEAFTVVRWLGAAYLVILGVRMLFARERIDAARPLRPHATFAGGAITQLSNPKALVFFTALLPQFIDAHRSLVPQVAILGVTSQVIEALVMTGYILLTSAASASFGRSALAGAFPRIAGVVMIGAAVKLALTKRT